MLSTDLIDTKELREALFIRVNAGLVTTQLNLRQLLQASDNGSLDIFKSEKGEPIAYIAFARISKQTLFHLSNSENLILRDYELNEGSIMFVMDIVSLKEHASLAKFLIKKTLKKFRIVCGRKKNSFNIYLKYKNKHKRVSLETRKLSNNRAEKLIKPKGLFFKK